MSPTQYKEFSKRFKKGCRKKKEEGLKKRELEQRKLKIRFHSLLFKDSTPPSTHPYLGAIHSSFSNNNTVCITLRRKICLY